MSTPDHHARPSGPSDIDADRTILEQAKGALMLHYGIGSHAALAVLVRWSRAADTDLRTVAATLVLDICQRKEDAPAREPSLVLWLDEQLRHAIPE